MKGRIPEPDEAVILGLECTVERLRSDLAAAQRFIAAIRSAVGGEPQWSADQIVDAVVAMMEQTDPTAKPEGWET